MSPLFAVGGLSVAAMGLWGGHAASKNMSPMHHSMFQGKHEAIQQVLENGDFEAWRDLLPDQAKIKEFVTEDNFELFQKMHQLHEAGDLEGAKAIHDQLNLPDRPEHMPTKGRSFMKEHGNRGEAIKEALQNRDYTAFLNALPEQAREHFKAQVSEQDWLQRVERRQQK